MIIWTKKNIENKPKKRMNWSTYPYVYDLYVNSTKTIRIWGKSKALRIAEQQAGNLFGQNHVELVDIKTGEIIFST